MIVVDLPIDPPTLVECLRDVLDEEARQWGDEIRAQNRQLVALRLASPMRADAGAPATAQADAGHLPLFKAANEPTLF